MKRRVSRRNEQVARSEAKPFSPTGLVHYTSNTSQSYGETEEMLTDDEIMACEAEDFVDYREELAEKAILLRHREKPDRGVIVKPCDSSRYFPGGKRKAKRNIRKRFGKYYKAPGVFVTLTYDHEKYWRWEAWERLTQDLKRFKHDLTMRYKRQGRASPKYISVIEEQSKTGYPHVHLFYPRLRWLLKKEDVQVLWGVGRTRVEYGRKVNIGGYVCKYITKMGGWSDEALAFIWKRKIRLYSYSRCYKLPDKEKEPSEWAFLITTTRTQIEDNVSLIIKAIPNIENLTDYLKELPDETVSQGRETRGRRQTLTSGREAE